MTEARKSVSWQEAVRVFTDDGLPAPPALSFWPAQVIQLDTHVFGSWQPQATLYEFDALLREAFERAPDGAVVFGIDGHGVQSWAAHLLLRRGALLIGFQVEAGGVYGDHSAAAERLGGAWGFLEELDAELARPEVAARLPAGKTLVALDSDLLEDRWAWLGSPAEWDSADWHEETPAAFLALMQLRNLGKAS